MTSGGNLNCFVTNSGKACSAKTAPDGLHRMEVKLRLTKQSDPRGRLGENDTTVRLFGYSLLI